MIPTIEQINEAIVKQKELAGDYFAGWYEEEISFALNFTKKAMEQLNIIPINDLKEHIENINCWCRPTIEDDILIHHSMDGREKFETGEKKK